MCIVRLSDLSSDDLASDQQVRKLRTLTKTPRSGLVIHEPAGVISRRSVSANHRLLSYRSPRHFRKE
jgi:hypothetical protein